MLSKNQIKYLTSLKQKKSREQLNLFVAEGNKIVSELIVSKINVKQVFGLVPALEKLNVSKETEIIAVKQADLERVSSLSTANEMIAVCEIPTHSLTISELKGKLTFLLDTIQDPGNLGTIMRVADWFGIDTIICSQQTVDVYNPKVIQATMGSIARVNVHYTDLNEFLTHDAHTLNLPVYGAMLNGENIYSKSLTSVGFILIGNESQGISPSLWPHITSKISIPSFSHFKSAPGEAESLNAAIAAAIISSEFRRNSN